MTIALLIVNAVAFVLQITAADPDALVLRFGFVPAEASLAAPLPLFTSMFLHGSLLHLGGNLLYLWIFGNNVEDVLGSPRFLAFYLACGLAGHAAHWLTDPHSSLPTIGASGAISGVLAAYLLRFPRASVTSAIFLIFIVRIVRVPAAVVIGIWIALQVLNGMVSLGGAPAGNVAWFEHLGGFAGGLMLLPLFAIGRARREVRWR
ncbi:MAG: rhomboid family intramembrane serine protease [Gemmatimonadetes bacterium]|nr:rhomboid family intramembrane serine protease [Gemmatimonadota bacterium]